MEACKITVSRCTYLEIDFLTAVKQSKKAKLMRHLKPYCSHESLRHKRSIWNIRSVFVSVFIKAQQRKMRKFEIIYKLKTMTSRLVWDKHNANHFWQSVDSKKACSLHFGNPSTGKIDLDYIKTVKQTLENRFISTIRR